MFFPLARPIDVAVCVVTDPVSIVVAPLGSIIGKDIPAVRPVVAIGVFEVVGNPVPVRVVRLPIAIGVTVRAGDDLLAPRFSTASSLTFDITALEAEWRALGPIDYHKHLAAPPGMEDMDEDGDNFAEEDYY